MPSIGGKLVTGEGVYQTPTVVAITTASQTSEESLKNLVKTSKPTQNPEEEECSSCISISDSSATDVGGIESTSGVFYDAVSCLSAVSNVHETVAECSQNNACEDRNMNADCKHMRKGVVCTPTMKASEEKESFLVPGLDELACLGGTAVGSPTYDNYKDMANALPYFVRGYVSRGFGRGSKDLGLPTANLNREAVVNLEENLLSGVYFGWAKVEPWPVMKMVMNLGWNPFFDNKEKTLEVHILHQFPLDFYGAQIRVCILGYLRPEAKFDCLKDLIKAIKNDARRAAENLDKPENLVYRVHRFFSCSERPQ